MKKPKTQTALRFFIAAVWLASGLFCKVLNLVPRHRQIVSRILGNEHAGILTVSIGLLEVLMAVWVLSRYQSKANAIVQMVVIAAMNILEFILAPDLLLWGRLNIVFAFVFIGGASQNVVKGKRVKFGEPNLFSHDKRRISGTSRRKV